MKTPFSLRKIPPEPASALLLLGEDVEALLRLCARCSRGESLPPVHAVAGGFLVRLPEGANHNRTEEVFCGVIRLRALSPGLFVPVDSALTPALLPDEANALVRQRGLVFLPGGVVLEFSPGKMLTAADLIAVPRLPARAWQPLPARPDRPEQLREILLDIPDPPPEVIIEQGGSGIGVEAPRPADSGPAQTLAGEAKAGLGRGMMWLGDKLGWQKLAGLGASLVASAVRSVPRISESILGQQEAALRELLRQFQEGKVDEALRRALPLGGTGGRGATPARDANLPTHNLFYRLGELLGAGSGPGSVWLSDRNVYADLEAAYRRAAEEATRRGDYRRAAFIYGKLLQDWHLATSVLSRGGLHHDAAILYLEKLNDPLAAARSFESAGEVDRALRLYQQRGEHALAGDMLMRAGETDRAVLEYVAAADQETARGHYLAAGTLLQTRAQRSDLAERYFAVGWLRRPLGDAPGCLSRLLELHAQQSRSEALFRLVAEADEFLAGAGNEQHAADFYNRLAMLAEKDNLEAVRDDLQDRALLGLARKLRQRSASGDHAGVVTRLLGNSGVWEPALVRDADVALRNQPRPRSGKRQEVARIATHALEVTAACAARETGELFLGFKDGVLVHFNPRSGAVMTWPAPGLGPVQGLATDGIARSLVVVQQRDAEILQVASYQAQGTDFVLHTRRRIEVAGGGLPQLTAIARGSMGSVVGLREGNALACLAGPDLVPDVRVDVKQGFETAIILDGWKPQMLLLSLLIFEGDELRFCYPDDGEKIPDPSRTIEQKTRSLFLPSFQPRSLVGGGAPGLSWLAPKRTHLELVYTDERGVLHWQALRVLAADGAVLKHFHTSTETGYRCAALLQPNKVAGVSSKGVAWLACGERGIVERSFTMLEPCDAIACFASPLTNEVLLVLALGNVVRVPVPG